MPPQTDDPLTLQHATEKRYSYGSIKDVNDDDQDAVGVGSIESSSSTFRKKLNSFQHDGQHSRSILLLIFLFTGIFVLMGVATACWYQHQFSLQRYDALDSSFENNMSTSSRSMTDQSAVNLSKVPTPDAKYLKKHSEAAQTARAAMKELNAHLHSRKHKIPAGCESTLMIVRHCEKMGPDTTDESGGQHCSYEGYERAVYLSTLFGTSTSSKPSRWPTPSNLYAFSMYRSGNRFQNFREHETLEPLANKFNMTIENIKHNPKHLVTTYFDALRSGSMCGKLVVACWKHSHIPGLAQALGCGPNSGCPDEYPVDTFDEVWELKYVYHPSRLDVQPATNSSNHGEQRSRATNPYRNDADDKSRRLKRFRRKQREGWILYGTVSKENFDPLEFSNSVGDYSNGLTTLKSGGRWIDHNLI